MDWLKSVKSFIFTVHLHVQDNDNHHEGTDSLQIASPPDSSIHDVSSPLAMNLVLNHLFHGFLQIQVQIL
uniref:Uncharacterized protein n=1 Tax=Brassica oleracea TaxID=3712 RepID=A0A3P6ESE7_BRAOL|nr:unnamed protein product [Brassica oleracea]